MTNKKEESSEFEKSLKKVGAISGREYEAFTSNLPVLSTGIFMLDLAIGPRDPVEGNGGIRARDIAEVCGTPGSGKTSLVNSMIKATQSRYPGKSVVGLFSEPPDIKRMEREGINVDDLVVIGAYHDDMTEKQKLAESGLDALLTLCQYDETKLCVIDSVGNLFSETQIYNPNNKERTLWDSNPVAGLAKTFNKFASDFTKKTKRAPLLMANHYRDPISSGGFSIPNMLEVQTPGGRTKEFLSMVRIRAYGTAAWAEEKHSQSGTRIQTGLDISYRMFRNKYANKDAFRVLKVNFDFSTCEFNNEESIFKVCEFFSPDERIPKLSKAGAWISIGEDKFLGMERVVEQIKHRPDLKKQLEDFAMSKADQYFLDGN